MNLSCECYGFKSQRYFEVPINFCIYNQNKTGECSFILIKFIGIRPQGESNPCIPKDMD